MYWLAASLASTYQMPAGPPPQMYQPEITLDISICPWTKSSQLRATELEDTVVSFIN